MRPPDDMGQNPTGRSQGHSALVEAANTIGKIVKAPFEGYPGNLTNRLKRETTGLADSPFVQVLDERCSDVGLNLSNFRHTLSFDHEGVSVRVQVGDHLSDCR